MYSIFPCIAIVHHYGCSALSKLLGSLCFRFCQGALMLAAAIDDADLVETLVGAGAEVFGLLGETGVGYNIFGALDMRIHGQQHYQNADRNVSSNKSCSRQRIQLCRKLWANFINQQVNLARGPQSSTCLVGSQTQADLVVSKAVLIKLRVLSWPDILERSSTTRTVVYNRVKKENTMSLWQTVEGAPLVNTKRRLESFVNIAKGAFFQFGHYYMHVLIRSRKPSSQEPSS